MLKRALAAIVEWFSSFELRLFWQTPLLSDGTVCRRCGREYGDPDSAGLCADWDAVLGVGRHGRR